MYVCLYDRGAHLFASSGGRYESQGTGAAEEYLHTNLGISHNLASVSVHFDLCSHTNLFLLPSDTIFFSFQIK